jgi:hypothetical protein
MIKFNCFIFALLVLAIYAQVDFGVVGDVESINKPKCSYNKALGTCSGICGTFGQCCVFAQTYLLDGTPACMCELTPSYPTCPRCIYKPFSIAVDADQDSLDKISKNPCVDV